MTNEPVPLIVAGLPVVDTGASILTNEPVPEVAVGTVLLLAPVCVPDADTGAVTLINEPAPVVPVPAGASTGAGVLLLVDEAFVPVGTVNPAVPGFVVMSPVAPAVDVWPFLGTPEPADVPLLPEHPTAT